MSFGLASLFLNVFSFLAFGNLLQAGGGTREQPPMLAIVMEFCKLGTIFNMVKSVSAGMSHVTVPPLLPPTRSSQYSDTPLQAAAESLMQAVQCSRTLVASHTQLDSHTDWIKELAEAALTQERTHHSHILQHSPHHASPYRRQLKAVCAPLFAPVAKDQNMCKNCICHSSCA